MKRILVIDDNVAILDVVQVILEGQGFVVETTTHAEEALAKVDSFHPYLILLDVYLAGTDGRQICRTLKSTEGTKDIPIIMFSAQSKLEEVLTQCNANDFMSKPFDVSDLIGKIRFHLKKDPSLMM